MPGLVRIATAAASARALHLQERFLHTERQLVAMPVRFSAVRPATVWITGDQCSTRNSALAGRAPDDAVVLMIESVARAKLTAYHKRKLVLVYAVMRHFAEDLRAAGWTVDYYTEHAEFAGALALHVARYRPASLRMMHQSE
jgi:deoxyribodipyrimidine photolyase-related protein